MSADTLRAALESIADNSHDWQAAKQARAALAAQQPEQPVAWQERQARRMKRGGPVTEWSGWYACEARDLSDPLASTDPAEQIPREWRPLYASPQAPQAVPTPKAPRLIGWRSDDYLEETADPKMAKNWAAHMKLLPIFEGDPYTKLAARPQAEQPKDTPT